VTRKDDDFYRVCLVSGVREGNCTDVATIQRMYLRDISMRDAVELAWNDERWAAVRAVPEDTIFLAYGQPRGECTAMERGVGHCT